MSIVAAIIYYLQLMRLHPEGGLRRKKQGMLDNVLTISGRVPFFYYILHVLLIHLH